MQLRALTLHLRWDDKSDLRNRWTEIYKDMLPEALRGFSRAPPRTGLVAKLGTTLNFELYNTWNAVSEWAELHVLSFGP